MSALPTSSAAPAPGIPRRLHAAFAIATFVTGIVDAVSYLGLGHVFSANMTGNVVLTQGPNVIRGARLSIDINTSQAHMEGGRVQMLIAPKSLQSSN